MIDLTTSHREDVAGRRRESGYNPAFIVGGEGGCCVVWHVERRDGGDERGVEDDRGGESRGGGRIRHIYLDELDHGTGVFSNTPQAHVPRLIARPTQPWLVPSPDTLFREAALDQTNSCGTKFREMKLEIEPRPCLKRRTAE